uniref:ZP domain-containing protein n=2 Tax=Caenorhabditis tropicalis TaxID=1561998 RepID=A0A1I7T8Q2_9PELO
MQFTLLFFIIASCTAIRFTDFSVHIKGKFLCHEQPFAKWPLDVFANTKRFRYDEYMNHFTKEYGSFDLRAFIQTDDYMVAPYILIQHNCWETREVPHRCFRKIIQPITPTNVTVGSQTPDENKTYDFGTVDLRFKHPYEAAVNCG